MTAAPLTLRILTPLGTAFEGAVDAVYIPGSAGRFEVLPGHAAIITTLVAGELRWRSPAGEESVKVLTGALRLKNDILTVCAELGE